MKVVEGFERVLLVVSPRQKWVKSVLPSRKVSVDEVVVKDMKNKTQVRIKLEEIICNPTLDLK